MLSEDFLMKVFRVNLEFKVPHFGRFSLSRIIVTILVLINATSQSYMYTANFRRTLWSFVFGLILLFWLLVLAAFLLTEWKGERSFIRIYNTILETDDPNSNNLSKEKDWVLTMIFGVIAFYVAQSILFTYQNNIGPTNAASMCAATVTQAAFLRLAILKYAIAKRLRHFRTDDEYLEDLEKMMKNTRRILEINSIFDTSHGPFITTFFMYGFLLLIYPAYTLWTIYGAGINIPSIFHYHLVPALINYACVMFIPLLMAMCSALVSDEVDEIKLQLDIQLSARPCTERNWKQIHLFVTELHHAPSQLSAQGFFDVSRTTVSTACALATSYLLVLIQYT